MTLIMDGFGTYVTMRAYANSPDLSTICGFFGDFIFTHDHWKVSLTPADAGLFGLPLTLKIFRTSTCPCIKERDRKWSSHDERFECWGEVEVRLLRKLKEGCAYKWNCRIENSELTMDLGVDSWDTFLSCVDTIDSENSITFSPRYYAYLHAFKLHLKIKWDDNVRAAISHTERKALGSLLSNTLGETAASGTPALPDLTLVVGDKEFRAHKHVLAVQSDVFRAMFQSGMREAHEGRVTVSDSTPEAVEALLKCVYGRNISQACSSLGAAVELLSAADKYNMQDIVFASEQLLLQSDVNRFSVTEALDAFVVGFQLQNRAVMKKAAEALKGKRDEIMSTDSMDIFVTENAHMVKYMLLLMAEP